MKNTSSSQRTLLEQLNGKLKQDYIKYGERPITNTLLVAWITEVTVSYHAKRKAERERSKAKEGYWNP